jgi:hypothetical protein
MTTLTAIEQQIRQELINFVKIGDNSKSFVRYKPLAEKLHILFGNEHERNLFYEMLGHISKYEFENTRPLLSVVVVNDEYAPGKGFFTLARSELKKQKHDEDNDKFALNERKAVFDYWKKNNDSDKATA